MSRSARSLTVTLALALTFLPACAPAFRLQRFQTNEELYAAALAEFEARRWQNAVLAFERLTLQLPARDTLLPRSHYYLGVAHRQRREHLLAAQSFVRLVETYPNDTLADDALFEAAAAYQRLWRRPTLDPQYGEVALASFETLLSAYPQSPLRTDTEASIARLRDWFAQREHEIGRHYHRRRAFDSAIIYYQSVVDQYPETDWARRSQLRLVEVYRRLNYREEAAEVCAALAQRFPNDGEVRRTCPAPAAAATTPAAPATVPPGAT